MTTTGLPDPEWERPDEQPKPQWTDVSNSSSHGVAPVEPVYRWPGGAGPMPPGSHPAPRPEPWEQFGYREHYPPQPPQPIVVQQTAAPYPPYRPPVNHVLHAVLTAVTCGLWAPVWIAAAIIHASRS